MFGGQAGFNYQMSPSFVAGIETDIQGAWLRSNSQAALIPDITGGAAFGSVAASQRVDWYGTLRGRLGFLVTPSWLLYATGGLAYGGVKSSLSYFDINHQGHPGLLAGGITNFSQTRVGWTLGLEQPAGRRRCRNRHHDGFDPHVPHVVPYAAGRRELQVRLGRRSGGRQVLIERHNRICLGKPGRKAGFFF